jgi:hypothetical protein
MTRRCKLHSTWGPRTERLHTTECDRYNNMLHFSVAACASMHTRHSPLLRIYPHAPVSTLSGVFVQPNSKTREREQRHAKGSDAVRKHITVVSCFMRARASYGQAVLATCWCDRLFDCDCVREKRASEREGDNVEMPCVNMNASRRCCAKSFSSFDSLQS